MPRVKPIAFLLGLYIPVLLLGLLLPRNTEIDNDTTPTSIILRILHEILYLTGPPEVILNLLLFIPFFLAIALRAPTLPISWGALISCFTSAVAEVTQSKIPGRVSSSRDFLSNCLGVLVAYALISLFSKKKKTVRP
jgi:glycopeptide antibiotics resistance protein